MENKNFNTITRGVWWGVLFWIPLIGQIIYVYKVCDKGKSSGRASRATATAFLWSVCLWIKAFAIIPLNEIVGTIIYFGLGLTGIVAVFILGIKNIGFRFFLGKLLALTLVVTMFAAIAVPVFMEKRQKEKATLFEQQDEKKKTPLQNSKSNSTAISSPKLSYILFDPTIGQPAGYIQDNFHPPFFIQR